MADHTLGTAERPLRVAIVGSGPSAFYAAEALFKAPGVEARVDMFDRLPTPFGLVRGGVAPDHQKIKSVTRVYDKIASEPGFRFFGNVMLGRDVHVDDLVARYDHVVYAVGNESDRKMGVAGEDLAGVHSATEFVGWYNGHPDFVDRSFDLSSARRVAIIGNGNVAMDVARVLVRSPDELADTDIAEHALEVLRHSAVREVILLGRRGPAQAAFSPKEIRELAEVEGVDLVVEPQDVEVDEVTGRWLEADAPRSARKNLQFLREQAERGPTGAERIVRCRFLVSPVEFVGDAGRVVAVRLQKNELYPGDDGTPRPRGTDREEVEDVQLVFKAVGYRGVPIPGVPFDERKGIIPNIGGRVLDAPGGDVIAGQYVVGWAKRGPTGLIGTNSPDSKATVAAMLDDAAATGVRRLADDDVGATEDLLRERGIDYTTFEDWQRLDAYEVAEGVRRGKVRHKITSIDEMLAVARSLREGSETR